MVRLILFQLMMEQKINFIQKIMSAEILIVDDNSDIRNIIKDLISDHGYKTRIAANFDQALSEIDKKLPDVAILDVKLDKGDNDVIVYHILKLKIKMFL